MVNEISRSQPGVVPIKAVGEVRPPEGAAREGGRPAPQGASAEGVVQKGRQAEGEPLDAVVQKLNDFVQVVQRELQFSIDRDNGEVVVKVVDARTKDVVREIPPEEVRQMRKRLEEVSQKLFDSQNGAGASVLFQAKA